VKEPNFFLLKIKLAFMLLFFGNCLYGEFLAYPRNGMSCIISNISYTEDESGLRKTKAVCIYFSDNKDEGYFVDRVISFHINGKVIAINFSGFYFWCLVEESNGSYSVGLYEIQQDVDSVNQVFLMSNVKYSKFKQKSNNKENALFIYTKSGSSFILSFKNGIAYIEMPDVQDDAGYANAASFFWLIDQKDNIFPLDPKERIAVKFRDLGPLKKINIKHFTDVYLRKDSDTFYSKGPIFIQEPALDFE
jgi:hypothetical protein